VLVSHACKATHMLERPGERMGMPADGSSRPPAPTWADLFLIQAETSAHGASAPRRALLRLVSALGLSGRGDACRQCASGVGPARGRRPAPAASMFSRPGTQARTPLKPRCAAAGAGHGARGGRLLCRLLHGAGGAHAAGRVLRRRGAGRLPLQRGAADRQRAVACARPGRPPPGLKARQCAGARPPPARGPIAGRQGSACAPALRRPAGESETGAGRRPNVVATALITKLGLC